MRIDVVTIFPEYLAPLRLSLVGKARDRGSLDLRVHDLRDHTHDRHRTVDDTPYGGGPGMVMRPEPWGEALDAILAQDPSDPVASAPGSGAAAPPAAGPPPLLVVPTPSGVRFDQATASAWAHRPWLVIACGRYEGIDARVTQHYRDRVEVAEVSLGDYVLAGGEAAALVIVEAVARLLPQVLGNPDSATQDSFSGEMAGLLEGPSYTKPPRWRDLEVPPVLLSGDHGRIARWRYEQAVQRTRQHRPDLLEPPRFGRPDGPVSD